MTPQAERRDAPKITGIYPPIIEKMKTEIQIMVLVDMN